MAHSAHSRRHARGRQTGGTLLAAPLLLFVLAGLAATAYVAYVLWPRWPESPVAVNAPAVPLIVAGVTFNIEPAAIRQPVQRRPGVQERVDLAYLWPSLAPADPSVKAVNGVPVNANERLFITIANGEDALPPLERIKTIYPRYLAATAEQAFDGLSARVFRDGTPYQGEDLLFDPASPDTFTLRCSRRGVGNAGICLLERRIGTADVTFRFPRDWLKDWKAVAAAADTLLARARPNAPRS